MIAVIPAEIKKGIGKFYLGNIQENQARGVGYLVGLSFNSCSETDFKTLCEYYKSLGGTVTYDSEYALNIDYDWGALSDCVLIGEIIQVGFITK
jgi:hypothetical protein